MSQAEITVVDTGQGCDCLSGAPMVLPAAQLSTNLFGEGARPILNRTHYVKPAAFDAVGQLVVADSAKPVPFPPYLTNHPYVSFLQDVRHYTNYSCTITVDCAARFYLLVDNRVNDFRELSALDDPSFGPPDTEWIPRDGWKRVETGISPKFGDLSRPDYVCIRESGIGAIHQFYAIYSKDLPNGGAVTLKTQFEGNMYCVVVATNSALALKPEPNVAASQPTVGGN